MRRTLGLAAFAILGLGAVIYLSGGVRTTPGTSRRASAAPDLLVIVLDSWRADALGREVRGEPVMPRLREWSRGATVFSNARAPSPSTPTSVSSLMTSLSVRVHGGTFQKGTPEGATTIAEILQGAGYRTLALSANPNCRPGLGHGQGFDRFEESFADALLAVGERRIREDHPAMLVPPERLLARARDLLEAHEEPAPLFAYVHVLQPHAPYEAAEPHAGHFVREGAPAISLEIQAMAVREEAGELDPVYLETLRARYDEHVRWTDAALGDFLDWLDGHPRWSRAAILVTSDHGEAFGEHERLLHNTTLLEEMLRVPLVMRLPGTSGEGRAVDERVGLIDIAPTLAALAGVEMPEICEGIDLAPLARGLSAAPRAHFLAATAPEARQDALLVGSLKLIRSRAGLELYDLDDDPGETRNLGGTRPDLREAMERALDDVIERAELAGLESAPVQTRSEEVKSILRSLGYAGGD